MIRVSSIRYAMDVHHKNQYYKTSRFIPQMKISLKKKFIQVVDLLLFVFMVLRGFLVLKFFCDNMEV